MMRDFDFLGLETKDLIRTKDHWTMAFGLWLVKNLTDKEL